MPKNSLVLRKKNNRLFFAAIIFVAVLSTAGIFLLAQELPLTESAASDDGRIRWYRSNASGMALEQINSRLAALRNEYSLSVQAIDRSRLPWILPLNVRPYYDDSFSVELRILYKEGSSFRMEDAEVRRQWIFRNSRGMAVVVVSGNPGFFNEEYRRTASPAKTENSNEDGEESDEDGEEEKAEEIKISGIIEMRNSAGLVTRELQFDQDLSEWDFRYFYREGTLLRAETWFKEAPLPPPAVPEEEAPLEDAELEDSELWEAEGEEIASDKTATATETATIEEPSKPPPLVEERKDPVLVLTYSDYYRYTRSGSLRAIDRIIHSDTVKSRVGFPRLGPGASLNEDFVSQDSAYTAGFFMGVSSPEGTTISYSLDSRGRILGEVWKDENGKIMGELKNTWSGERLQSVSWISEDDNRLIEYEYDSKGNTRVERNFRFGELERTMAYEDGRDIEEIYINGRLILRAYWENGQKVKEERIFSQGSASSESTSARGTIR